jgi:putative transposase
LFGKTKQAYYKKKLSSEKKIINEAMVLEMVKKIKKRTKTKRWGGRKLHPLLELEKSGFSIKIGRDKLFGLLRENGLLVKPRKRKYFTTQSHHWLRKYENLVENLVINRPNQLWVSDITYLKINQDVYYLYLITDAYSQKIVGFNISMDLKARSAVAALKMALRDNPGNHCYGLIHHSDRGIQYCSQEYVSILNKNGVLISMTNPASPHENAIAERINGILKDEWLYDLELAQNENPYKKVKDIIGIYNQLRPHNSLNNMTPGQIHDKGFLRHKAERVIGKTYSWIKKNDPEKGHSNQSNYAIGPNDYSLASCSSAELASALSWHCKFELNQTVISTWNYKGWLQNSLWYWVLK